MLKRSCYFLTPHSGISHLSIFAELKRRYTDEIELLFDPQTSGGLLLAVPDAQADDLIVALKKEGVDAATRVGNVVASDKPHIHVV